MPELPEMETYKKLLNLQVAGKRIDSVLVNRERTVNTLADQFISHVTGRTIVDIDRRAKHLLFRLDSGRVLLLHLMLGGWMYYGTEEDQPSHTSQVVLNFHSSRLYFLGLRLGYLHLLSSLELTDKLADLGPEPLSGEFTAGLFKHMVRGKRGVLKTTLVNQKFIAGIGNCYADEICFAAQIHPLRKVQQLSEQEIHQLYLSIRSVLTEAVNKGGYMEKPFFKGDTLTGGMDEYCRVYDREGEPCFRCGNPIQRQIVSARKVFHCAVCQH